MQAQPNLGDPISPSAPGTPEADETRRLRAALHRFLDMTTDIAEGTHAEIMALPKPAAPPDPANAAKPAPNPRVPLAASFDHTARTARLCIMLIQRLADPPAPPKPTPEQRTAARSHIIRVVEDTIQREVEGEAELNFGYELDERLDLLDVDGAITARPPQEIITEILRDMGLTAVPGTRPWKRRTPPDIVELTTWAADPPKPFIPRNFPERRSSA